jgi:osmotically-inducible protein OsmY
MAGVSHPAKYSSRVRMYLFLTLALLGFPASVRTADEHSGPFLFVSADRTVKDIEIETKIRRTLRQDAKLGSLNLTVHMSGGMVKLSGPVPTAELKQRAITIVQRIEGVLSVSGKDLYVSTADQGGKRLSVVIPEEQPTQTRAASPVLPSSGSGAFDLRSPAGTGQQNSWLTPQKASPPARVPEPARLTANPHAASLTVSIANAVDRLRRNELRYQQIRARVQGTTVYISPGDTKSEDAMTFAQAVRRLSGVQHVILVSDPR